MASFDAIMVGELPEVRAMFTRLVMLGAVFYAAPTAAQSDGRGLGIYVSVTGSYMDIKEESNHGFVFRGPDASLAFGRQLINGSRYVDYAITLGGGGKVGAGSWGFRWLLEPFRGAYLRNVRQSVGGSSLYFGPSVWISYDVQTYPDMHAGFIHWMTDHGVGVQAAGFLMLGSRTVTVRAETALLSLTSRPALERDPHLFRIGVGDVLSDIHSNLQLQLPWNHTRALLEIGLPVGRPSALTYAARYQGHYVTPRFARLSHELRYSMSLGGSR